MDKENKVLNGINPKSYKALLTQTKKSIKYIFLLKNSKIIDFRL